MAIAYVGSAGSTVTAATSISVSYTSSGGRIILAFTSPSAAPTPSDNFTDSAGNNYFFVGATHTITGSVIYIYATQSAINLSITSVTVSGLASGNYELIVLEYSGVADIRTLAGITASGNSTNPSISSTLNAGNNFLVAMAHHTTNSTSVFTAQTGNLRIQQGSSSNRRTAVIDNTAASAISVTCSATITSLAWGMCIIELVAVVTLNAKNLTSGEVAAAGGTSSRITPTSGNLYIIQYALGHNAALVRDIGPGQIAGCGLNWHLISEVVAANGSGTSPSTSVSWWWAVADANCFAGALTFTNSLGLPASAGWTVDEITGQDNTTPISWCVQAIINKTGGVTASNTASITLGALQNTSSMSYANINTSASVANTTLGAGYQQVVKAATRSSSINEYLINDTAPSATFTTSVNWVMLALEITAANSGGRINPLASNTVALGGS